jgi:hypothetical protein
MEDSANKKLNDLDNSVIKEIELPNVNDPDKDLGGAVNETPRHKKDESY